MREMLDKETIEPLSDLSTPGFYSIPGAQIVRQVSAGHRPIVPQRPLGHSDFPCGDSRADPPLSAPGLLGNIVFSHTAPSVLSKIPSVSDRGLLSVLGSPRLLGCSPR